MVRKSSAMKVITPKNQLVKVDLGAKFAHAKVLARYESVERVPTLRGEDELHVVCPTKILECDPRIRSILADIVMNNVKSNTYRIAVERRQLLGEEELIWKID